jgi:hypothetical protein
MSAYSINKLNDVIFKILDQYKCKQILVLLTNDGGACGFNVLGNILYFSLVSISKIEFTETKLILKESSRKV